MGAETPVLDLPPGQQRGNEPFRPKERAAASFSGHTESTANLPGAGAHWQGRWFGGAGREDGEFVKKFQRLSQNA